MNTDFWIKTNKKRIKSFLSVFTPALAAGASVCGQKTNF
jgi:hypothetical protein